MLPVSSITISSQLFHGLEKCMEVLFTIIESKELTSDEEDVLKNISGIVKSVNESAIRSADTPFMIGLLPQEYAVLRNELKVGNHLHDLVEKFKMTSVDTNLKTGHVIIQGLTDSPETMFNVGHWVGRIHEMKKCIHGENYKIDPDWDSRPNN